MSKSKVIIQILALPSRSYPPKYLPKTLKQSYSRTFATTSKSLATHSEIPPNSKSASDLLDRLAAESRRSGGSKSALDGRESVGPFPLGVGPSGRSKGWKPWSQLGLGGKVARTTAQTGNLTVILIGGGLFVILAFALTTELFAKNSPSVLYSQAVDMIRSSDALNAHLLPPLTFTHSPNPTAPSRGSQPIAHRLVRHPTSARDHLLITFYIHGRGRDEPDNSISGYMHTARIWAESGVRKVGEIVGLVESGSEVEEVEVVSSDKGVGGGGAQEEVGKKGGLSGLFGLGLRSASSPTRGGLRGPPPPGTYKLAEVRADYVKNAAGHFTLLAMVVDVPSSRVPHPIRNTIFWSPEADTEGLLGRKPK